MNESECRTQVFDSYVKELSGEISHANTDRWSTMYNSSYNERLSRGDKKCIAGPETISNTEMKGHGKYSNFHSKDGIPLQEIANHGSNMTGYRLVDSARCEWFRDSQKLNSPRRTMYQTHFPDPHSRLTHMTVTKSRDQYRLEQVYRHMGNRVSNIKKELEMR